METGTVVLTVGRVPAEQTGGRKEPVGKTDGFWTGSEKDASLFPSIGHRDTLSYPKPRLLTVLFQIRFFGLMGFS